MKAKELSPPQIAAIKRSIILGRSLKQEHPEIADFYREGESLISISDRLNVKQEYRVYGNVALKGVQNAISGHEGKFGLECYDGLIPDNEEREVLARQHRQKYGQFAREEGLGVHGRTAEQMSEDGRKGGYKTYKEGLGIFGRTAEQMSEDSRISGLKGGRKTYEEGLGIFGRTAEQWGEDSRKGGYNATLNRGQIPWVTGRIPEIEYAHALTFLPEFQKGSYNNDNVLIALELNIEYHNCEEVRTARTVKDKLSGYRRSLEDKV
ncbi:MAG: hypothetical protein IH845_01865 [Nanoarchaeota archaeon]|nr:hypothetical protein [Nanoarchaeota archaeon]